ncbi:hypothetical protein DL96DRAFT_1670722 [Flagelloscypha sp. PMI_526]|nr:hypothetical protein DL96DRAFT_1670722 [Flagelloscypha sp. PMI_526]
MTARIPAGTLGKELVKISQKWPQDPFRPHLQINTFLASLATHPKLTPNAVKATQTLLNGDISKKFPLSEKMMQPAAFPKYYDRMQVGMEKALQGIPRPWWKIVLRIW